MAEVLDAHRQGEHLLRLEWGLAGALAVADGCATAVVVDVLSFTTSVSIAVERGATVLPYRWGDGTAPAYADAHEAVLAGGRRSALSDGAPSLSPASLVELADVDRLVLPSPNGSTIALALAESGTTVVAASLRNASAVAAWLAPRVDRAVALVPAGERWPDGSLRPAVEDLWGAGAVLSALVRRPGVSLGEGLSPEARAAAAAYDAVRSRGTGALADELAACASGRELVEAGFARDVALSAELDASPVVPVLRPGRPEFRAEGLPPVR